MMSRFRTALLAGTLLPVVTLTPVASADADQVLIAEDYGSQDRVSRYSWSSPMLINHAVGVAITDLRTPGGMTIGPDGDLYVSSFDADTVLRFDLQTGERIGDGIFIGTGIGGLDGPGGLAFEPDGRLLVSSYLNNQVLRYDVDGAPLGPAVDAGSALIGPGELLIAPDGSLIVSSRVNDRIIRFDSDGSGWNEDGTFIATGLNEPRGLAIGPEDGHLYVASYANDRILRYDLDTGEQIGSHIASTGLDGPVGIVFDELANLIVASRNSNRVLRFNAPSGFLIGTEIDTDLVRPLHLLFVPATGDCAADVNGDCEIGFADLLEVLSQWGPCPGCSE